MVDKLSKICSECPRKNPVEDIWLQTKNFMIASYHLCSSFQIVKWLFEFFADGQIFDFPKLFQYGILPQPPRGLLYFFIAYFKFFHPLVNWWLIKILFFLLSDKTLLL